jgi:hypothetical protein
MKPAEILAQAAQRGVEVELNPTGDGLRLRSDGDPPTDLVELLKGIKPELVAHLRARARALLLEAVEAAPPCDVSDSVWQTALRGLRAFLANGHSDAAEAAGWPRDELYAVPEAWARVDACGAALLIGDATVVEVASTRIQIRTASGSTQAFYRKPKFDIALAYSARLKSLGLDATEQEPCLRAREAVVLSYQAHCRCDYETAKAAVLAAIASSPGAPVR